MLASMDGSLLAALMVVDIQVYFFGRIIVKQCRKDTFSRTRGLLQVDYTQGGLFDNEKQLLVVDFSKAKCADIDGIICQFAPENTRSDLLISGPASYDNQRMAAMDKFKRDKSDILVSTASYMDGQNLPQCTQLAIMGKAKEYLTESIQDGYINSFRGQKEHLSEAIARSCVKEKQALFSSTLTFIKLQLRQPLPATQTMPTRPLLTPLTMLSPRKLASLLLQIQLKTTKRMQSRRLLLSLNWKDELDLAQSPSC